MAIHDWSAGQPAQSDNTNFEWVAGAPYIIIGSGTPGNVSPDAVHINMTVAAPTITGLAVVSPGAVHLEMNVPAPTITGMALVTVNAVQLNMFIPTHQVAGDIAETKGRKRHTFRDRART